MRGPKSTDTQWVMHGGLGLLQEARLVLLDLNQTAAFPIVAGFPAETRGELVESEDEKVHETAWTATAYGGALSRCSSCHLTHSPSLLPFLRQQFSFHYYFTPQESTTMLPFLFFPFKN